MTTPTSYEDFVSGFRWRIPERYNIAVDVCDRWAAADPDRTAILDVAPNGRIEAWSFASLSEASNRLANALRAHGVQAGDRVAVLLPQSPAVVVAHLAIYKLGAVALPLAVVFGPEALLHRLRDAGARAVVTHAGGVAKLGPLRDALPDLELVVSTDGAGDRALGYADLLAAASPNLVPVDTRADDPALMIYTSGTTGPPKGALHGHRVLLGHLPGFSMMHEFMPRRGDRMWTPADWAWAGGLLNALLPSLHHGVAVVARKAEKFEPEEAFRLMADLSVANAFVPPTALRMLRTVEDPRGRFDLSHLRTLASAGEMLGPETFNWARDALGLTINEAYGQTECNLVLASCAALGLARPGSTGKPVPGHRVAVIRPDGSPADPDETGQIAVARPDPVMFLRYWNDPEATERKFLRDWMTTGDQGRMDEDGYVHFVGRDDDVITSSGYRIGPGEIEDCLLRHPAVALAAAVGKPDPVRTEIVKAFVVLRTGYAPSDTLAAGIQAFVRTHLSAHEYPREIAFRPTLPLTTTGKIIRRVLRDEA
ncbi:AMP-binding protein [Methylobacterium sp. 17Sr1-1]|uniref:AMP-binding protein n=1 Tax=Methylobacterium sp. 17Sr1-1 TaxID=2202826 RepID=UPI000D702B96|nr:AMP-binding protein [Methylobacterium sp. 17Sr1-1]AWN50559.1 AMP-dependent synthetase [Methylobacterium sp. 17Sr1-1]